MGRKWRSEAERHAFFLSKKVDRAIRDHQMIDEGDKILIGVSGGKDSLALLRLLIYRLQQSPVKHEVAAAHVCGDARGIRVEPARELIDWVASEGLALHVREMATNETDPGPMNCERCSRARRRTLFEMADSLGCNKVALGHTLEDFAATALMNLLTHGRLETMAFNRSYFGGKFAVIRPLAYIREKDIVRFAKACCLPVLPTDCPLANSSSRASARKLIAVVTHEFRHASENLVKAAVPREKDE